MKRPEALKKLRNVLFEKASSSLIAKELSSLCSLKKPTEIVCFWIRGLVCAQSMKSVPTPADSSPPSGLGRDIAPENSHFSEENSRRLREGLSSFFTGARARLSLSQNGITADPLYSFSAGISPALHSSKNRRLLWASQTENSKSRSSHCRSL